MDVETAHTHSTPNMIPGLLQLHGVTSSSPSINTFFFGVSAKWIANEFFTKCEETINKERKKAQAAASSSMSGMGSWFTSCVPRRKSARLSTSSKQTTAGNNNNITNNQQPQLLQQKQQGNNSSNVTFSADDADHPDANANIEAQKEITIKNIIDSVVMSMTNTSKVSVAELLMLSPDTRHLVKQKADYYVSCSSEQSLISLVESLDDTLLQPLSSERIANGNQNDDVFVYIDFLCQNLWAMNDISQDRMQMFLSVTLPNAIENIGKFLLLLDGSDATTIANANQSAKLLEKPTKSLNVSSNASDVKSSVVKRDIKALSSTASSNGSVDLATYEQRSNTNMTSVLRSRKCLWELYCAASGKHKSEAFVFKLSHRNERHKKKMIENAYTFPEALLKDFGRMIKFEKSVGSSELEDVTLNQILIGYGISPSQLNQAVLLLLARWMAETCQLFLLKIEATIGNNDKQLGSIGNENGIDATAIHAAAKSDPMLADSGPSKSTNTQKFQKRKILLCTALAQLYEKLDDMKNAELYNRRLVAETEKTYGPLVRHTAVAWHSLAHFLTKRSRKEYILEAMIYYNKALEYCKGYGEAERIPVILNDIALCEKLLGVPERSIPLYLEALSYWQMRGQDSTEIATCMSNLANSYAASGNLGEALRYHTQSLQVIERLLGPKNPQYAKRLVRIARIQFMLGAQSIGNELVQKALQIYQDAFGPESAEFQRIKANVMKELQQPSEALEVS